MKPRTNAERAACAAFPLAVIALAFMSACNDSLPPGQDSPDHWADDVAVKVQIRSELQPWIGGRPLPASKVRVSEGTLPLIPAPAAAARARLARAPAGGPVIRHVVEANGTVRSLAIVRGQADQPPKRLYVFENGRIQLIYSPHYRRVAKGWIRDRASLVLFDSTGKPAAQFKVTASETAAAVGWSRRIRSAADAVATAGAVFLPHAAFAEEITESDCWREFLKVVAAELGMEGTALVTMLTAAGCTGSGGTLTPACAGAILGLAGTLEMFDKLLTSMDALIKCELQKWIKETNPTGTGGGGSTQPTSTAPADNTTVKTTTKTVTEFIEDAEKNGTYWCNEDGSYCYYYAE